MAEPAKSPGRSAELFPHTFNVREDSVSFIRLSRPDYVAASFLDARILTPRTIGQTMAWREVAAWIETANLPERCDFIFHIGHVGSTLLSRLLGAHPRILALREPMILRTCAQFGMEPSARPPEWGGVEFDVRLGGCVKLLSRTFEAHENALVKATSFVSEMAAALLSRTPAPKAMMMFVSAESYLATILGGPNSRTEAKMLAPSRLRRLHRRIGTEAWRLESLSEGELLALGWACEMSALAHAAQLPRAADAADAPDTADARVLRLDFDEFLTDPRPLLRAALRHFDIDATPGEVAAILAGPLMRRYSKAPEHAYDAALRLAVLNEARAAHGAEISRGLAWLERAAADFSPIRDAIAFAGTDPPKI
jgi:hypothetical protein